MEMKEFDRNGFTRESMARECGADSEDLVLIGNTWYIDDEPVMY